MGMTGSGKSTVSLVIVVSPFTKPFNQFLNLIIGDNQFKVGHGLISETADIQEFQFPYQDEAGNERLLCLIDTPGFGDTSKLYVLRSLCQQFHHSKSRSVWNSDSGTLGVISAGLLERYECIWTQCMMSYNCNP